MDRDVAEILVEWKDSESRKPLIVRGARQIGKTWIVRELGRDHFKSFVEIDFEQSPDLKTIFDTRPRDNYCKPVALFGRLRVRTVSPIQEVRSQKSGARIQNSE